MKALAVLLVTLIVCGALVMVQAQVEDASVPSTVPQQAKTLYKSIVAGRWWLVRVLVRNGEPTTLTDVKVLTFDKGLMVLSNGLNVIVPGRWVKDGDVVAREDLLNDLVGQTITIQALKIEYTNKYTATVYFAYKLGDANAMLPWNITPEATA
ncbi:MAG: hypothetical protein NTY03_09520 [Candidatus Bathyarchaeota archaeon]|nr:hypothetical protein [Candidatus Bathyarchaeota archaeon]